MLTALPRYLAQLRAPKITLWCYLIWYVTMLVYHFDSSASLWINSLGICIVIGTALILSVLPPGGLGAMDKWQVARLFMMPLAVSSFAALIKDKGFFVIFSPILHENLLALAACATFVAVTLACKQWARP